MKQMGFQNKMTDVSLKTGLVGEGERLINYTSAHICSAICALSAPALDFKTKIQELSPVSRRMFQE